MDEDSIPCCAADALRRIRRVKIGGADIGLSMLEEVMAEVRALNCNDEHQISLEILKRIKIYNYIPKPAEIMYADALLDEYKKVK